MTGIHNSPVPADQPNDATPPHPSLTTRGLTSQETASEKARAAALSTQATTTEASPGPLSGHRVERHDISKDVQNFMNDVKSSKNTQTTVIDDQTKQRNTRIKTQLIYGSIIALGFIVVVTAIATASVFGGPFAGVIVAGVGLVAGAALVAWASPHFIKASDAPSQKEIQTSENHLKTIEKALRYFETTKEHDYSFQKFLNEEFSSPYYVQDLNDYMNLYDRKVEINNLANDSKRFTKENAVLEAKIENLKKLQASPHQELEKIEAEADSIRFSLEARKGVTESLHTEIQGLEKQIAERAKETKSTERELERTLGQISRSASRSSSPEREEEQEEPKEITSAASHLLLEKKRLKNLLLEFEKADKNDKARLEKLKNDSKTVTQFGKLQEDIDKAEKTRAANKEEIEKCKGEKAIRERDFESHKQIFLNKQKKPDFNEAGAAQQLPETPSPVGKPAVPPTGGVATPLASQVPAAPSGFVPGPPTDKPPTMEEVAARSATRANSPLDFLEGPPSASSFTDMLIATAQRKKTPESFYNAAEQCEKDNRLKEALDYYEKVQNSEGLKKYDIKTRIERVKSAIEEQKKATT